MPDREKIIVRTLENKLTKAQLNNIHEVFMTTDVLMEIISVIKEQNGEVKPFHKCVLSDSYTMIEDSHFDYCPYCGKKVNWE